MTDLVTATCCKPFQAPVGSGRWYWWHSHSCPEHPGEQIRRVGQGDAHTVQVLTTRHEAETRSVGVATGRTQPSLNAAVRTWLKDPEGCGCADCTYVEAWMDRDD